MMLEIFVQVYPTEFNAKPLNREAQLGISFFGGCDFVQGESKWDKGSNFYASKYLFQFHVQDF